MPLTERDVEAMPAFNDARWDTATVLLGLDRASRRRLGAEDIRERAEAKLGYLAPVRRIRAIPAGGFWIERIDHRPAAEIEIEECAGGSPYRLDRDTRWDVFGRDGVFRFTVELPPRFSPLLVTDTSVTGVFWDDLDVEYVVGYRVRER